MNPSFFKGFEGAMEKEAAQLRIPAPVGKAVKSSRDSYVKRYGGVPRATSASKEELDKAIQQKKEQYRSFLSK